MQLRLLAWILLLVPVLAQNAITQPFLEPEPETPTCSVRAEVDIGTSYFDAIALAQPTVSPVPTSVLGNITFNITNLLPITIEPRWSLDVELPLGATFTQLKNAQLGNTTVGSNSTELIELVAAYEDQVLLPSGASIVLLQVVVNATTQAFTPQAVYLNGEQCQLTLDVEVTDVTPDIPQDTSELIESSPVAISIRGTDLYGVDGNKLQLKGINFFGFELEATMLDGLYFSQTLTGDYAAVLYRLQLLGFNAVRLPFSFQVLFNAKPVSYTRSCSAASNQDFVNNVTPPGSSAPPANSLPGIVAPPANYNKGTCNADLPNNSVYTRFLYTVRYLAANNFYVVLDNQLNTDPTCPNNANRWVQLWTQLLTDVVKDGVTGNRVIVDILNEPDAAKFRWGPGNSLPGMTANYLAAMDAMYKVNPDQLFMVEGLAQQGLAVCWGDGFSTDSAALSRFSNVQTAASFFDAVMDKPYLGNLIISVHYYGPSISTNKDRFSGADLVNRATTTFGYLNYGKGYCRKDGKCKAFPIIIGETGSALTNPSDTQFYNTFIPYLQNTGIGRDGKHNAIPHVFWWAWNANSGDTGGLVDTTWRQILWNKVSLLERIYGLRPFALGGSASPSSPGSLTESAPDTPSPPDTPASELNASDVQPPAEAPPGTPPPSPFAPEGSTAPLPDNSTGISIPIPGARPSPGLPLAPSPSPSFSPVPAVSPNPSPMLPGPLVPAPSIPATSSPASGTPAPATAAPPAGPVPGSPPTGPPSAALPCAVRYRVGGVPWRMARLYLNTVQLFLQSAGPATITPPYTVEVTNAEYGQVTGAWNWEVTGNTSGSVTGVCAAFWEVLEPQMASIVNVGFNVAGPSTGPAYAPSQVSINGTICSLTT